MTFFSTFNFQKLKLQNYFQTLVLWVRRHGRLFLLQLQLKLKPAGKQENSDWSHQQLS